MSNTVYHVARDLRALISSNASELEIVECLLRFREDGVREALADAAKHAPNLEVALWLRRLAAAHPASEPEPRAELDEAAWRRTIMLTFEYDTLGSWRTAAIRLARLAHRKGATQAEIVAAAKGEG